jgi:DnaJ-class molecular chaperone
VRQGAFELRHTCAACQGRGGSWDRPCPDCDGAGGTVETETLAVTVPGGVDDGQVLRLKGKGNDPDGTGPGDLYLRLEVGPDPRLSRVGADLHARVKVDAEVAREGGKAKVPVPRGAVDVDVEPGTRSGDQRRLRGYGAVKLGSPSVPLPSGAEDPYRSVDPSEHRGDLVVTFEVEGQPLPEEQLSPEEREARDVERSDRRFLWASLVAGAVLAAAWLLSGAG